MSTGESKGWIARLPAFTRNPLFIVGITVAAVTEIGVYAVYFHGRNKNGEELGVKKGEDISALSSTKKA